MISDKIIIVGGGSAGWMTATTLIRLFPNKKITLIESPDTPVVGVGESTLGFINDWMDLIGLKDKEWMKDCDATYKLSIKFIDFYKKGSAGFHYPFGVPFELGLPAGKNTWSFKKMHEPLTPWSDYARFLYPGMALVESNRFGENINGDLGNFNLKQNSAYHFDAVKFGQSLKDNICIPEGVKHIIEDVKTVEKDDHGNIVSLNNKYFADLFIDCTGFKSLLLGKEMQVPFENYNDMLPNDTAIACQIPYNDKEKELVSFTSCTAIENGWVWRIPSWNRIGTGYVYSSKYVSDQQAKIEFISHLMTTYSIDAREFNFKKIPMKVGLHKNIFFKNVVAIGLSAGFIEPLESNGLFTVHQFLIQLARLLSNDEINQLDKDMFNKTCIDEFNNMAEFVAIHYYLSKRNDTKYWRDLQNKSIKDFAKIPNGDIRELLNHKQVNGFNSYGGLHCIATGMRNLAIDPIEVRLRNKVDNIKKFVEDSLYTQIKARNLFMDAWKQAAKSKPKLIDVLKEIHESS